MSRPSRTRARAVALAALLALVLGAPGMLRAADVEARYRDAANAFHALRTGGHATAAQWRAVGDQFRGIFSDVPQSRRGADALYSAGLAVRQAWQVGSDWRDLSRAVSTFREFAGRYPDDRLADDALMHLGALLSDGYNDLAAARDTYQRLLKTYPDGDQTEAAQQRLSTVQAAMVAAAKQEHVQAAATRTAPSLPALVAASAAQAAAPTQAANAPAATTVAAGDGPAAAKAAAVGEAARRELAALAAASVGGKDDQAPTRDPRVRRVQVWSAQDWTRVIITTDPGVHYEVNRLDADATRPARVYFDLQGAQPADDLAAVTSVNDLVLAKIRAGRFDDSTTRVVLDLKALDTFEVKDFRLPSERKIVVDLHPTAAALAGARKRLAPKVAVAAPAAPAPAPVQATAQGPAQTPKPTPASNRLLPEPFANVPAGLRVHSIMIDPGHGGHDPGAIAFGVSEKDLALEISRHLRDLLKKRHPDLRVGMTRDTDAFIPLAERPQIAKRFGADLFVSVHLNANPIHRFHGVETYFLNLTNDRDALQVAARENGTSDQHAGDLNDILKDLLRDSNLIESGELAKTVQGSLVDTLRESSGPVRDLGVKQAPFLVLMGAEMPSVLVEAGFVTNRDENQRLRDPDYLDRIAEGIYDGLRRYIEQQNIISAGRVTGPVAANDTP